MGLRLPRAAAAALKRDRAGSEQTPAGHSVNGSLSPQGRAAPLLGAPQGNPGGPGSLRDLGSQPTHLEAPMYHLTQERAAEAQAARQPPLPTSRTRRSCFTGCKKLGGQDSARRPGVWVGRLQRPLRPSQVRAFRWSRSPSPAAAAALQVVDASILLRKLHSVPRTLGPMTPQKLRAADLI
nr:uncharacterized protein LOC123568800 [Macaca fascicularis]